MNEAAFREWYAEMAERYDLDPDPDAPGTFYDYRAAFLADAKPDESGHWPSKFKKSGHPNEVVGGFSTITGERVPGTRQMSEADLVGHGWDEGAAKSLVARESKKFDVRPILTRSGRAPGDPSSLVEQLVAQVMGR
jgi:hypothetical protein